MKRIFAFLIACSFLLALSVPSFAISWIYINIEYRFEDDPEAFSYETKQVFKGESFSYKVPDVPGYTPSCNVISGVADSHKNYIVIYKPEKKYTVLNSDTVSNSLNLFCDNFKPTLTTGLCFMSISVGIFTFLKVFRKFTF